MKKILLLVFIIISFNIFSDEYKNYLLLEEGSDHYIFEKKVNIRSKPSIKSDIIGGAVIGEPITIIMKTDKKEEIYNMKAYWYHIKWNNKTGYIWGGLISSMEVEADFNNDGKKELLLSLCKTKHEIYAGEYMASYTHQLKLCRKGELIKDNPFNMKVLDSSSIKLIESSGLTPDIPLIDFTYSFGDGPGYTTTTEIFYFKNNIFELAFEYSSGGSFLSEIIESKVQYPKDHGIKNTIIIEIHKTLYDEETEEKIDEFIENTIKYKWDGKSFKQVK